MPMHFKTAIVFKAWMSNYIPLFYADVIIYPCPNSNAGFADIC